MSSMNTSDNKALFLSYASPAFAPALRRGKQDAKAARLRCAVRRVYAAFLRRLPRSMRTMWTGLMS